MRGDGDVFRKPGSRFWHYVFWADGNRVRGSTGKEDEEQARRFLQRKMASVRDGDAVPGEERLVLEDIEQLLVESYKARRNRSLSTMRCSFRHVVDYFGPRAKVVKLGARIEEYLLHRRAEGAADASIRIELALLDRGCKLAVEKQRLSPRRRPYIQKPAEDETRVRQGFFRRADVERLCSACDCPAEIRTRRSPEEGDAQKPWCWHLPPEVADVVTFLFFCPWRVGAARGLEWRDYSAADQALTLRRELNKTKREMRIPVDPESTPELMAIIERQRARRRPDCPFIFHGRTCGTPRFDKQGKRRPCLGDFQKVWDVACKGIGMAGRIPHDLRRSGVKHYIDAGVDPHTVMLWSGHRTESMLRRYHIIDLDDLRRAGQQASSFRGAKPNVIRADFSGRERTATEPPQNHVKSRVASGPQLS